MIGKITIGKSFRGCIAYCLNDKLQERNKEQVVKDRAQVLMYNKCFGNEKELMQQFNEVRQLNPKLSKPVLHITLSLAPGEIVGKDKLMEMTEHCAKEFDFGNNQYIAICHSDTDHQHLHIVANRIGFDKRTVNDSNNYQTMSNFCRKMELKYRLRQVLSPRRYLAKDQRNIPRFDQRKENLKAQVKDALKGCSNFSQFEQRMKQRGYEIIKGRGISFADEKKVTVKGSELNYSLQTIEKILARQRSGEFNIQGQGSLIHRNEDVAEAGELSRELGVKEGLSRIVEDVMQPERLHEESNRVLLPQKRKKQKRQSGHL